MKKILLLCFCLFLILPSSGQAFEIGGVELWPKTELDEDSNDIIDPEHLPAAGAGTVDTTGTPAANQIAVFSDENTIQGMAESAFKSLFNIIGLGETSSDAYRGDRGATAYGHSQAGHAPSGAEVNPALISQAEAEAGTSTTERMFSALRVAQAIAALGVAGSTDDQTALEVPTDTSLFNGLLSTSETTVQAVLDIFDDLEISDLWDFDFNDLINVPAGIADGDDDTQLSEGQVDAYANNNGYLSAVTGTQLNNVWSTNGILTRTGLYTFSYIPDNSTSWNAAFTWGDHSAANYESETHASEHAVGGADSVFPPDPDYDGYLIWDDSLGGPVWYDPPSYSAGVGLALEGFALSLSHLGFESLTAPGANRIPYITGGVFAWLDYSGWDLNAADDFSGAYGDLSGTPSTFPPADNSVTDTKLASSAGVNVQIGNGLIAAGDEVKIQAPFAMTITSVTALADQSGSIEVDIWKDTYANYPPTVADTIVASAPISITTATKSTDVTLTGWTTAISAGDIMILHVNSVTDITEILITLNGTR